MRRLRLSVRLLPRDMQRITEMERKCKHDMEHLVITNKAGQSEIGVTSDNARDGIMTVVRP